MNAAELPRLTVKMYIQCLLEPKHEFTIQTATEGHEFFTDITAKKLLINDSPAKVSVVITFFT